MEPVASAYNCTVFSAEIINLQALTSSMLASANCIGLARLLCDSAMSVTTIIWKTPALRESHNGLLVSLISPNPKNKSVMSDPRRDIKFNQPCN